MNWKVEEVKITTHGAVYTIPELWYLRINGAIEAKAFFYEEKLYLITIKEGGGTYAFRRQGLSQYMVEKAIKQLIVNQNKGENCDKDE